MAVSSTSYFSNSVVGVPNIASLVQVTEQSEQPRFALGTKFERQDGAIFRYAHFGATINSAGLIVGPDMDENGFEPSEITTDTKSAYQMGNEQYGIYPGMKGSRYLVLTKSGVKVDDYAGGYLTINNFTTQHGHTYRIKGNTATGTPISTTFRVELYSKLLDGYNSGAIVAISGCKYNNLEPVAWVNSDMPVGVSIQSSNTTKCYGWVQTKGIVACLQDTTTPYSGRQASVSTGASVGEVGLHVEIETSSVVVPVVGKYVQGGTASWFTLVDVNLE